MKKILLFTCLLALLSCKKEEKAQKDYFIEPLVYWTHTKEMVKAQETRDLIADRQPDYYTLIGNEFESTGSGGLEFKGEIEQLTKVEYCFFSYNKTLVQVVCHFVNNATIDQELNAYMVKKYGSLYDESVDGTEKILTWIKPGMTIIMAKSNYGLIVIYRKRV